MVEVERAVNPNNIYVGMRYVPIYEGEWVQTKAYESLVIVTHNNDTYISNSPVPANTEITNTTYWAKMYGGNQQLEDVHTLVEGFQTQLDNMNDKLDELGQGGYVWKPALAYNMAPGTDITDRLEQLGSGDNIGFSAGTYTISRPLNITARCYFAPGAVLKSSSDLRFLKDVIAGPWQIFNIGNPASPIKYILSNREIRPEWYGAAENGMNDTSYFFEAALNGQQPNKTLLLGSGAYPINRTINLPYSTHLKGNGCVIEFGTEGSIKISGSPTPQPQTIIERISFTSENTNPVIHVTSTQSQVIIRNCSITGNFLFVNVETGVSNEQNNEIIFDNDFITGETVTLSSLSHDLENVSNQWTISIKECIFSNSSNTMLLSSDTISALKSDVYLDRCITSSSPTIYSYGNLHIINNFPTTVRGTHFIGKDTDITLDASNGSTVTFEASHCNLTMGGPGITIDLGGCGDIMSCNLKGTQPFNFQALTKGSRVIISKTFINSEGVVNLTGTNGWDNGVLITDCNFGSDRVINSPSTFVFNNSPWGGVTKTNFPGFYPLYTGPWRLTESAIGLNSGGGHTIIANWPSTLPNFFQFDVRLGVSWNEKNNSFVLPGFDSDVTNITIANNNYVRFAFAGATNNGSVPQTIDFNITLRPNRKYGHMSFTLPPNEISRVYSALVNRYDSISFRWMIYNTITFQTETKTYSFPFYSNMFITIYRDS